MSENNAAERRRRLVAELVKEGTLRSQPWREALLHVPRHAFLRRFFRQTDDQTGWSAIDDQHSDWLELAYSNTTWVTQLDRDDAKWHAAVREGKVTGTPTSSSTAPGLMALMLEALEVNDDHNVLEIGTATGYNAAILSHRLTAKQVTSVEHDPHIAAAAAQALTHVGYRPHLVTGDGALGHPDNAPYDRIIATCSFPAIPPAWLTQIGPGGVILTNIHRDLGGGALIRLTAESEGASGAFLPDYGGFMAARSCPTVDAEALLKQALDGPAGRQRPTSVSADVLDHPDFGMVAALLLPEVTPIGFDPGTGYQQWLLAPDGSWASVVPAAATIEQHGPMLLWDRVEAAYAQWQRSGTPTRDRYGLTVTRDGDHILWLDAPETASRFSRTHLRER